MEKKYRVGVIRVITQDAETSGCHGRLLESYFPIFQITSRCLPDRPDGIHDNETENMAVPKVLALAKEFEEMGMDGIIINCCGDPALELVREHVSIPVAGGGESTAALARLYGDKIFSLGITPEAPRNYKKVLGSHFIDNGIPEGVNCTLDLLSEQGRRQVCATARQLKERGADAIALACTGMATIGIAPLLEKETGIPVLDPVLCEGMAMYLELLRREMRNK